MALDILSKLKTAGEAAYKCLPILPEKLAARKARHEAEAIEEEQAEVIRLRNEAIRQKNDLLARIKGKLTGESMIDMAPLEYVPEETQKAVFLVTIPITFGRFELSESSYKLLARHVGMSLDSVSHWAVCVADRGMDICYCYDLMSDRMELNALGRNFFRVVEITPEFIPTWSSCYYIGETTKSHEEIQEIGMKHMALHPRYNLLSNNCQHLVDSLVKELCNGKVISQAKLDAELSLASPKIARDLLVARVRSKLDVAGEKEDSESVKEDVDMIHRLRDILQYR